MESTLRRQIYWLLIIVAVGIAASRIVSAQRVYEPSMATDGRKDDWRGRWPDKRPKPAATYSSNDRSRWATVRALVDDGTYVVGTRDCRQVVYSAVAPLAGGNALEVAVLSEAGYLVRTKNNDLFQRIGPKPYQQLPDRGIIFEDGWESIDRVLKPAPVLGDDGTPIRWEFYSSKPPLLATLMAGLYWLLQQITGWTLAVNYVEVVRTLLLIVHPLPFALYLWVLGCMVERYGRTDWGRFYVMVAGSFATLMPAFLNTFNNHTLGTFSVLFAVYSVTEICERRSSAKPQAAVWHHYLLAGLFAAFAAANELPALSLTCALGLLLLCWSPWRTLCFFLPPVLLIAAAFLGTNYLAVGQLRPAYSEFGGLIPFKREVVADLSQQEKGSPWYQYEGSHWLKPVAGQKPRHGIDWARYYEDRWTYAFHLLLGHHGFFSLTPIWLLAFVGAIGALKSTLSKSRRLRALLLKLNIPANASSIMYERFTDRARKVMQLANQEAQRFNHEYIGTEHILLGLVREGTGVTANVFKNLDTDLRKIRLEVEKIVQSGPDMVTMGKLPMTPGAKKVIEYSIEEARNLNHNYVGTELLFLGLLHEQEGVAAQVLSKLGLKLEVVRKEIQNPLAAEGQNRATQSKPDSTSPASVCLLTPQPDHAAGLPWFIAPLTLAVSVVVIGFYLVMSENYGGFAVGPRWLIWLSPLLLLCLLPLADLMASCRWKRGLALVFLGFSAFSAFYSSWNPWRHPWIYDLLEWLGWVAY